MRRSVLATGALVLIALVLLGWWSMRQPLPEGPAGPIQLRAPDRPLTLAATGDSVIGRELPAAGVDPGFDGVVQTLHASSLAITDLEEPLGDGTATGDPQRTVRWVSGTRRTAADLRRLGFTIAARANDHAGDDGGEGIAQAGRLLTQAGLAHAGAGEDLRHARQAVMVGARPRRVALIAVSTSVLAEQRATATRGEIHGRAGVSALRYTANVTADPATYRALSEVAAVSGQAPAAGGGLNLSGTVIRKGDHTTVSFTADPGDVEEILAEVKRARGDADIVVISLHSHEPENRNDAPADFVRDFARQAIDAGAGLVVGHGPRQLRGIEIYNGAAIFYSLGSFIFDYAAINRDAVNLFDTTMNFYERALSTNADGAAFTLAAYDEPFWWQSVIATATFDGAALKSIVLTPIVLGEALPKSERGTPHLAGQREGDAILRRLADRSASFATGIAIQDGSGRVTLRP